MSRARKPLAGYLLLGTLGLCQLSHHETGIGGSDRSGLDYAARIMPIN
jgi:hypothetical protein